MAKELKTAVPAGLCGTCRWARELPDELKMGPFVLDCQGQPFIYQMHERPTNTLGSDGKPKVELAMQYHARPHTEHDFCALYEDRPKVDGAAPVDDQDDE